MRIETNKCPLHGWKEVSCTLVIADYWAISVGWYWRNWGLGMFYTIEDPAYDLQFKVGPAFLSFSHLKPEFQELDQEISSLIGFGDLDEEF